MKKIFFTLLFTIISSSVFSQRAITKSQAINIISKQAMLSQRMAKSKVYKTQRVNITRLNTELNSSVILFEKNIKTLTKAKLPTEIQKKINRLDLLWVGYKANIRSFTSTANSKTSTYSDIVLTECNEIYSDLVASSKINKSYPFNSNNDKFTEAVIKNNNIRYLSQQLAFYYVTYYYKVSKYDNAAFSEIINKIDNCVKACLAIKNVNIQIAEKTDEVEFTWKTMKDELSAILQNKFISTHSSPSPEAIYQKCDKLLSDADKLSRAYKTVNDLENN
ncbi:hypothetical protein ACXGQW_07735 [Wenyingzhuangia sp. IMCC45533]